MIKAKVTSKYQVTIPRALAERLGIAPGDDIEWSQAGESILTQHHVCLSSCGSNYSMLRRRGGAIVSAAESYQHRQTARGAATTRTNVAALADTNVSTGLSRATREHRTSGANRVLRGCHAATAESRLAATTSPRSRDARQMRAYAEVHGMKELISEDFEDGRLYGSVRAIDPFQS